MAHKVNFRNILSVLKQSFSGFSDDKVPKLSASLAYCTVFSFAPLLIVIIYVCSFFFAKEAIQGSIYNQLSGFVGADTAGQLQDIIKNAAISGSGTVAIIIGVVTLIFGATSIFAEVQDSINGIWGLKAKPKMGIKLFIRNRLLSFGILGSLGFLLLVSLAVSTIVDGLGHRLQQLLPGVTVVVMYALNIIISLGITTVLFAVIYKVLPDALIKWKDVWPGAIATALLFMMGKFLISIYISKSKVGSTYGAAGSIVVLLVWIYYSAFILYFGAEFTKHWALKFTQAIRPSRYAVVVEKEEVEKRSRVVKQ